MKKIVLLLLISPLSLIAQNFWTEVAPFSTNPTYYPRQISIVNDEVVWVRGYDFNNATNFTEQISISVDAGMTWSANSINIGSAYGISSFHAVSATTAYATAFPTGSNQSGGLFRTQDSGTTWQQLTSGALANPQSFPNFVHFFDTNNGVVVADPVDDYFQILLTSDAGSNWSQVSEANLPPLLPGEYGYSLNYRTKGSTVWFGTNKGRIFKSTDMGSSWSVRQSPISDFSSALESGTFDFRTQNEGVLVTMDFNFFRTVDAGNNWTQEYPSGIRNFETVFVNGTANTYFAIGEAMESGERGSSYSTDGGLNWIDLNTVDPDPVIPVTAKFSSGTVGFCIGSYQSELPETKRFFRLTDPLNRFLQNEKFVKSLFSAVPNPSNGKFTLSGFPISHVTISDMSGKMLLRENYNDLSEVTLDLSLWQSGIYFAKITTQSGASETVKIMKK